MNPDKPRGVQHPITQNIPLPGNYACITLQLNVTRYASAQTGRFVLVVREPSEGIEIMREFMDRCSWMEMITFVQRAVAQAMRNMAYMQDGNLHD